MSLSLLLVSNDINLRRNFKGKSRVTRCENSKSRSTLLGQITSHEANLGPITHHASRKPLCHPKNVCVGGYVVWPFKRSPIRYSKRRVHGLIVAWDQSLFFSFSSTAERSPEPNVAIEYFRSILRLIFINLTAFPWQQAERSHRSNARK